MGTATQTSTNADGSTTTTTYSCNKKAMQYTIIGEDIKADFDFLLPTGEIGNKLDEMLSNLKNAADITDAFYFENGSTASDIQHVYDEIDADVKNLKNTLNTLHSAFITDIDNINAELEVNFGHWIGYKCNKAEKH